MNLPELCVVGDHHVAFWNGLYSPRIQTQQIAKPYQLSAVVASVPAEYKGWLLFSFGSLEPDVDDAVPPHVVISEIAVLLEVERYMAFFRQIRMVHPKLAVWGPLAARISPTGNTTRERNRTILSFVALLRTRLATLDIPLLSFAEEMIGPDGLSREEFFADGVHLATRALPQALRMLHDTLGISPQTRAQPSATSVPESLQERRILNFERVEHIVKNQWPWTEFALGDEARFLTVAFIAKPLLSRLHTVTIGTSADGEAFTYVSHSLENADGSDKYAYKLPVMAQAKTVIMSGVMGIVKEEDIDIFAQLPVPAPLTRTQ